MHGTPGYQHWNEQGLGQSYQGLDLWFQVTWGFSKLVLNAKSSRQRDGLRTPFEVSNILVGLHNLGTVLQVLEDLLH